MSENKIYETIAKRCGGDVYVGVVGPVRTGKSTFIHRFMESVVLPNIADEYERARALDEIPQSGSGKTITTTEPKFVPCEAVKVNLDGTDINIRMIDCVGYMVDGALGVTEDGETRIVKTPWSEEGVDLPTAAEIGTDKVISEHSTIAVMVTTDGSITDIPREGYVEAEERAIAKIKEAGKPFAIVLNSRNPESPEAVSLAEALEKKYSAPVAQLSCEKLKNLQQRLLDGLGSLPNVTVYSQPNDSGIVAFNVRQFDSAVVSDYLSQNHDIATRSGLHCAPLMHKHLGTLSTGVVRSSLAVSNTTAEVDYFLSVIDDLSQKGSL